MFVGRLSAVTRAMGATLWLALVAFVVLPVAAQAKITHDPLGTFGPAGSGSGTFSEVESIAVDSSTGNVYVYDHAAQAIYKFDAEGNPVSFSATGTNSIQGTGGAGQGENELAVDSSPGVTKGDIYLAVSSSSPVKIYAPTGALLGTLSDGSEPCGIAVDPKGNVYIGRYPEFIDKYSPKGNPVKEGDYVSRVQTSGTGLCNVAADGKEDVYAFKYRIGGVEKYEASQFSPLGSTQFPVVVDGTGSSLAVDSVSEDVYVNPQTQQVEQYDSAGNLLGTINTAHGSGSFGIGVNGSSGKVYISGNGRIEVFGPSLFVPDVVTSPASEVKGPTATLNGTVNPDGTAVTKCEFEYGPSTEYGQSAACEGAPGSGSQAVPVSVSLSGLQLGTTYHFRLVAGNQNGNEAGADQTFTTQGPPLIRKESAASPSPTEATLGAEINPDAFDTTYNVEYGPTQSYGSTAFASPVDIGSAPGFQAIKVALTGLTAATTYHYRVVATNSEGTVTGEDRTFTTEPPARIDRVFSVEDRISTATLRAQIVPFGADTSYHFEYGTDESYGTDVPVPAGTIGGVNGSNDVEVSAQLVGLKTNTTYHFRVVASNVYGTSVSSEAQFATEEEPISGAPDGCPNASLRAGFSKGLSDCRSYEMVSPVEKNGADVGGDSAKEVTASESGDRVVFLSKTGFGDTAGSSWIGYTQFMAERGPSGWSTKSITPTPAADTGLQAILGYTMVDEFSQDLGLAGLVGFNLPHSPPGATPEAENLYVESTPERRLVTTITDGRNEGESESGLGSQLLTPELGGASASLDVVTFESRRNLVPQAHGSVRKAYVSEHGEVKLLGVMPDGTVPSVGSNLVYGLTPSTTAFDDEAIELKDTVSADGSRVLFEVPEAQPQLFMRKNGSASVHVSESETTQPAVATNVTVRAASPDLKHVVFGASSGLVNGAPSSSGAGSRLFYLYTDGPNPQGEKNLQLIGEGGVVLGMSEDGSHVYYQSGQGINLWDNGHVQQVAPAGGTLGEARVSADGRKLAFMDNAALTSAAVIWKVASITNTQMYVYDENSDRLKCVSCPPTGAAVADGVDVRVNATSSGLSISMSSQINFFSRDGRYVFFNTEEALLPQDTNGVMDAYEYDTVTGLLSLISTGTGEYPAWFVAASADGRDAFIVTRQPISRWDPDKLDDLYDARAGGGLPEPPFPAGLCAGDACQGTPSAAPSFNAASGFVGLGNPSFAAPVAVKTKAAQAQQLRRALARCRKGPKRKRAHCERVARRRYRVSKTARRSSRAGR